MPKLSLHITGPDGAPLGRFVVDRPVELGRQRASAEPICELIAGRDAARVNIAPSAGSPEILAIPRTWLRLEPLLGQRVRATNPHDQSVVDCVGHEALWPKSRLDYDLPVEFVVGNRRVRVEHEPAGLDFAQTLVPPDHEERGAAPAAAGGLQSLVWKAAVPGRTPLGTPPRESRDEPLGLPAAAVAWKSPADSQSTRSLVRWFQAVTDLLHRAVSSDDFFQEAARAVVELVGLDAGQVLLWRNGDWERAAVAMRDPQGSPPAEPSNRILQRLLTDQRTFWQDVLGDEKQSLTGIHGVLASPILDPAGEVIGAIYADRRSAWDQAGSGISELHALLVETIAGGVAAGLARLAHEKAALAAQVRFEQFFTPELADYLTRQPDLLRGRDAEVTLLFCDIRNFSRISGNLSPRETMEWIGAVMTALSDCVLAEQGVLVDYIGDELMAMWGAPGEQPDHAARACRAAIAMTAAVAELSPGWEARIGAAIEVGVGINSGRAHVGNTGSQRKFKYGALGSAVNIASRVQGVTKYLHAPLLVTGATQGQLDAGFLRRRVCRARLFNIKDAVALYELSPTSSPERVELFARYEGALAAFEQGRYRDCVQSLGEVLADHPDDGPSLSLLTRALNAQLSIDGGGEAEWEFTSK
ncbi:MAG: adenylate/guanylate cyclase domain-containing protein [Planctomycetaceae bacterium]|nr:adenylate/guanylate cyclase domain-containing protein [Planctomycetaceae bacterium]